MKQLLVFLFLLCSVSVSAQDVIVKKDGSTVVCRVVEVTATEITYKKWGNLNGSNYVMDKSLASAINYEGGKHEKFSEAVNLYKPGNQNDGVQLYNDNALLKMDEEANYTPPTPPKVKTLRIIGFAGGGAIYLGGILYLIDCEDKLKGDEKLSDSDGIISFSVMGAGGLCMLGFNIAANKVSKKLEKRYDSHSLYQHSFPFSNGSSLSSGTDVINDRLLCRKTIGLGSLVTA